MRREPDPSATLEALEALYDLHAEAIYRYVLGMLGRREDAEDAVQTIWLKLARSRLESVRDPQAYLWTAARHHVRTAGRRRLRALDRSFESLEPEMLPAAENPGLEPEQRRDIQHAIGRLPARLREMVVLVGFGGLTLREASARLDIPIGTAASRYRRAVENLRIRLRPQKESK